VGLLGTGAGLKADVNLLVQLFMGAALLAGMLLARRKRYRAHAVCQGTVMALNLFMIAFVMLPSFRWGVAPGLPREIGKPYYYVATLHATMGTIAQLLGLYIVLRAATDWLPERLRFQNYKRWMRGELALWWSVIVLGVATYYIWL
jgi:uncharacterized membrane protein YozB (DUF420 family)